MGRQRLVAWNEDFKKFLPRKGELVVRWVLLVHLTEPDDQQLRLDAQMLVRAASGGDSGGEVAAATVTGDREPGPGMSLAHGLDDRGAVIEGCRKGMLWG